METREQKMFLQAEGCDTGQGYRYGRHIPAEEIANLLHEQWGRDSVGEPQVMNRK
jgi:EAL domain-containing protein (putative c-di-GMP-specific phosphodiesterase class I)